MGVRSRFGRFLTPDYLEARVEDIDLEAWHQAGIKGVILDVDDTLTTKNSPRVAAGVLSWLKRTEDSGFACIIVSNNRYPAHIEQVSKRLGIPAVARAGKPRSNGFHWALQELGLPPEHVVVVGDRILTDILGGARMGMKTCLVAPVTKVLSRQKQTLYAFEKWLSQVLKP